MKRLFDPCRHQRQNLALLAAGALSDSEAPEVERHLAACAGCRAYFAEMRSMADALSNSARACEEIQPTDAAAVRWQRAIHAASAATNRHEAPVSAAWSWWREVIWPWRRVWAGLAVVWMLILAGNLTLRGSASERISITPMLTQRMAASFHYQQAVLAELLAERSLPPDADRQKNFSPKPRTERICFTNV